MEQEGKVYGFSYTRAIACIAIIVLHVCASSAILYEENVMQNVTSRAIANCMMWAVPCFVMVTGALLLDKTREISYNKVFKKYILRIMGALLIFCMTYRIFDMIMDQEKASFIILFSGLYELFTGTSWSHMWYLYLLIGLYLLMPIYKKVVMYSKSSEFHWLMGIYVVFISLLPLLKIWDINSGFYIHVSTIYPFYLFLGYALHNGILKFSRNVALLMIVASSASIVLLTFVRWYYQMEALEQLWSYSSILVILQSTGVFLLLSRIKAGDHWLKRVLVEIDRNSFGIYLVHMIFIRWILRYRAVDPYGENAIFTFIFIIIWVFVASYIVTWSLKKIPWICKIV